MAEYCAVPGFEFVKGRLAKEVLDGGKAPSPASGYSLEDFGADTNEGTGAYWLVEPRRAKHVDKWSGTYQQRTHAGLMGNTIAAFIHFVWNESKMSDQRWVLADLQSTFIFNLLSFAFLTLCAML